MEKYKFIKFKFIKFLLIFIYNMKYINPLKKILNQKTKGQLKIYTQYIYTQNIKQKTNKNKTRKY